MQAVRSGRAVPPRLLEPPPEAQLGLGLYMNAFFALASDRPPGPGRIPWSSVHLYAQRFGLSGTDEDDLHFLLVRMDLAYLDWVNKKSKTGNGTKPNADPRAVRRKDA